MFNDSPSLLFCFPTSSSFLPSIEIKIRHVHHSSETVNHNTMLKLLSPTSLRLCGGWSSLPPCLPVDILLLPAPYVLFLWRPVSSYFLFIKIYVKNLLLKWGNIYLVFCQCLSAHCLWNFMSPKNIFGNWPRPLKFCSLTATWFVILVLTSWAGDISFYISGY